VKRNGGEWGREEYVGGGRESRSKIGGEGRVEERGGERRG